MRKRYKIAYKEEMARLKANRDFQLKEKERAERERRLFRKCKRSTDAIDYFFRYDRYKRRHRK